MTERRRRERYAFSTPTTVVSDGVETCAALMDVSFDGVRVRLDADTFLGSICVFTAAAFNVRVSGRVVWRRGREIGIRFLAADAELPARSQFGRRRLQG